MALSVWLWQPSPYALTTIAVNISHPYFDMASGLEIREIVHTGLIACSANSLKNILRWKITKMKLGGLLSDFDKSLEALDLAQIEVEMPF